MLNQALTTLGILCLIALMSCAKTNKELTWDAEVHTIADSRYLLKHEVKDSLYQAIEGRRVKRGKRIIETKKEAINLAKPAFLEELGTDYNIEERRYIVHLVNGFWIVKGLQPRGYTGGTLVAIIDSESGQFLTTLYWK